MPGHRKTPFSAKQKKKQLQEKRERNRGRFDQVDEEGMPIVGRRSRSHSSQKKCPQVADTTVNVKKINQQPGKNKNGHYDPNRYRLHFVKDSDQDIEDRKKKARIPFKVLPEESLELDVNLIFEPGSALDLPKRPSWNYKMTKEIVERQEEKYFQEYLDRLFETYKSDNLSFVELNLETWRQLWRVLAMSDIILIITDIRHPALHFSPALYDHITKDLQKEVILVLNKIDLVQSSLVIAWKRYFQIKFPKLKIVCFTSYPKDREEIEIDSKRSVFKKRKLKKRGFGVGASKLLQICQEIVQDKVDLSSWKRRIEIQIVNEGSDNEEEDAAEIRVEEEIIDTGERFKGGMLTIGCCGYPNVGKSSLMNGLVGKKVVSVSKTPGHTKHFQTIYLTKTVKLCDCPGLVFPSLTDKSLQILSGIYPIAQVREPYSSVGFLSERLDLTKILKLKHPSDDENCNEWSAWDVCDAWAAKKGFLTAKAARRDVYRAANHILRLAVEGRICLAFRPPNYTANKSVWENDPEAQSIDQQQEEHSKRNTLSLPEDDEDNSEDAERDYEDGDEDEEDEVENQDGEENLCAMKLTKNPFSVLQDD
ncbi:DgyrCDS7598 [Dimorphilus gyrociliatus]|uniref:Guanine nucleotide-binding protein-like 1 n=1 Tax=Dimorphilus gyrociliatus TaxID=2664684 RepID=A0A7I8VWF7_9ANNE|nr:DgyrCDS7598 [Dimorphilus gyrociliatus]